MESPTETPPKSPRRWWSISLRAMLLLVLVIGIPMGWWARQAQLQRRAVTMIEAANGSVVYDNEVLKRVQDASVDTLTPEGERRLMERAKSLGQRRPPLIGSPSPGLVASPDALMIWAGRNLGIDFVDDVVQVATIAVKPGEMFEPSRLADLPKLERLVIVLKPIRDDDLVHLEGLRHLRSLCLDHTKITDSGLSHIEKLDRLEDLILTHNGDGITDAGLARLKGLKRLRMLEIGGPKITDAGLAHLRELPELRSLLLSDAPNVSYRAIHDLERALPRLKVRH